METVMKDDFVVDKAEGKRWNLALEILRDGKSFNYQGIIFSLDINQRILACGVVVDTMNPASITEDKALKEYELAKKIVDELIKNSEELKRLIVGYKKKFSIVHDYGTGIVELFNIIDGKIQKR